jgi:hypothetical protein
MSNGLAYILMHYDFFSRRGKEIMSAWIDSEDGHQFWIGQIASCARQTGFSAIVELAVVVVLWLRYAPLRIVSGSGETTSPVEELIPFLNHFSARRRQFFFVRLGHALLQRLGIGHGQNCFQLVNLLYPSLPMDNVPILIERACEWLFDDMCERGRRPGDAFLSHQTSLRQMVMHCPEFDRRASI